MGRFEYKSINGLNFILMHDIMDLNEIESVWITYKFLKDRLLPPDGTASAQNCDGTPIKKNKGIFLTEVHPVPSICTLIENKLLSGMNSLKPQLTPDSVYYSAGLAYLWHGILMQYYMEDGDKYDSHIDNAQFSSILFFNQEPKNFTGGEIEFPHHNILIPFKNNCGIIFPSQVHHRVLPVTQINKDTDDGGRLTVTMFSGAIQQ